MTWRQVVALILVVGLVAAAGGLAWSALRAEDDATSPSDAGGSTTSLSATPTRPARSSPSSVRTRRAASARPTTTRPTWPACWTWPPTGTPAVRGAASGTSRDVSR